MRPKNLRELADPVPGVFRQAHPHRQGDPLEPHLQAGQHQQQDPAADPHPLHSYPQ
jgi:hypothetical protein